MRFLRLLRWIPLVCVYFCASTVAAQAVGLGVMWSRGTLTKEKIVRYAAMIYGFGQRDPLFGTSDEHAAKDAGKMSRADVLAQRVANHPILADRRKAVARETENIDDRVRDLRRNKERYDFVKKTFDDLLDQLERDAKTSGLQEVQRTLEAMPPKKSKGLILGMLQEDASDADDDALADVVTIIRSMSQDKLRKILGEFKTEDERSTLHQIMMEIGEIESSQRGEREP